MPDKSNGVQHVEAPIAADTLAARTEDVFGTVELISSNNEIVLIPIPTQDPRDPLNLPLWRRVLIMLVTSIFGTLALIVVSGLGAVIGFFLPEYVAEGRSVAEITHLFTLPALAMGIGNFFSMPLALAVGRRPVFLGSVALVSIMSVLCAVNQGYNWHLGARIVLGLAAGQCEALTPMMIQETHFIHERARVLTWQWAIQSTLGGLLSTISSYQTAALGLRWWYGFYAISSAVLLVVAFFAVPETRYDRPVSAYEGRPTAAAEHDFKTNAVLAQNLTRVTTRMNREFDLVNFKPRTFRSDLRLKVGRADWREAGLCYKHMAQLFCFPNVCWVVLMNGVLLGINVAIGTTYGNILLAAPYKWANSSVGFAQSGQIVVAFIAIPILGFYSDWNIKWMSKRNGGVHEAEFRLVPLILPIVVGIVACVMYGQAAQYPEKYSWFAIVFGYCAQFYSFVGASIVGQSYLLDAYPSRQGAVLVLVCAMRGVIQFGLSYGVTQFSETSGYAVVFGTYSALTAFFGVTGILVFFFGKKIRKFTEKWAIDEHDADSNHMGEAYHKAMMDADGEKLV